MRPLWMTMGVMNCLPSAGFPSLSSLRMPLLSLASAAGTSAVALRPTADANAASRPANVLRVNDFIHPSFVNSGKLWQSETEDVTARCDRNILFPVYRIAHGRGAHVLASIEVPEWLAVACVDSLERLRIVAEKHQPARRAHGAASRMHRAYLRVFPCQRTRTQIERNQDFLPFIARNSFGSSGVVGLAF